MQISDFWARMDQTFGSAYAQSIATDHTLSELGGRTVDEAMSDGENIKRIWMAVCRNFEDRVPKRLWR
ncbi:DUF3046 domain-containing protein [Haloglycomyces albus]|uniref:DUF3046 domain-containing protein n=1 Tax=Haloglycomyces albus TaxID=526067 RepID=UPI00046D2A47|nr:DUF3046 domain-containing protein [Haloglycomyces albus]